MTLKRLREIRNLLVECGENLPRYVDDWAEDSVSLQIAVSDLLHELREADAYRLTADELDRKWRVA